MTRFSTSLILALTLTLAACTKLPPNVSWEGKTAIRGNQLVEALRATVPAIKNVTCNPPTVVPPACVPPETSVRIFATLKTVGEASVQLAEVLTAVDAAKDNVARQGEMTKATALLRTIQQTLVQVQVIPAAEETRQTVVQVFQSVMAIIATIGLF